MKKSLSLVLIVIFVMSLFFTGCTPKQETVDASAEDFSIRPLAELSKT